ncbi:MAG: hypothetical protein J6K97_04040, partial [Clostridia bacterium]|nr:hypothetical protein [Clostridia bacterium]
MKKFFVGLLSIFMLFGAAIVTACGKSNPTLEVYYNGQELNQTIEVEINSSDPDGGYALITAEMSGVKSAEISASVLSGYENVLEVAEVDGGSKTKSVFKITGKTETESPAIVVLHATPGNLEKYVYVDVYSNVSSMQQNNDEKFESANFLVEGLEYTIGENGLTSRVNSLTENQLIDFYPSANSRRNLTWQIKDVTTGQFSDVTSFTLSDDNKNIVRATEEGQKDYAILKVSAGDSVEPIEISLPVLSSLEEDVDIEWSYDNNAPTGSSETGKEDNPFKIVPNIQSDDNYTGYAWIGYNGKLSITPVVEKKVLSGGEIVWEKLLDEKPNADFPSHLLLENNLTILKDSVSEPTGQTIYSINAAKADLNNSYRVKFRVGYANYDYAGYTKEIYINVGEKVSQVLVSTKGYTDILGDQDKTTILEIFDNYGKTIYSNDKGQKFSVNLAPSTVIGGTNNYFLTLDISSVDVLTGGKITNDEKSPIVVYYKGIDGRFEQIPLNWDGEKYVSGNIDGGGNLVRKEISAVGEIYIKAGENLVNTTTAGAALKFISVDNEKASTSIGLTLKKSASSEQFKEIVDEDADNGNITIDSSKLGKTYTKTFTLKGQSTLDGLIGPADSEYIDYSPLKLVASNDELGNESITFSFTATLKNNAYGVTAEEKYVISHKNGSSTDTEDKDSFTVNIILPFSEVRVFPDTGSSMSNSITDITYSEDGKTVSSLMLKNGTVTPLVFLMDTINEKSPKADLTVTFLDYVEGGVKDVYDSLDSFKALSKDYLREYAALPTATQTSSVIGFTIESLDDVVSGSSASIVTEGVGYTYFLLSFTGKSIGEEDTTQTIIIFIENYVSPESVEVYPYADKEVTLFAADSLSSDEEDFNKLTKKTINVRFANSNTTYADLSNFEFKSDFSDGFLNFANFVQYSRETIDTEDGTEIVEKNKHNKYYEISTPSVSSAGISFTITALTTIDDTNFFDHLTIRYLIERDGKILYENITGVEITVKNAQRIESVAWKNADPEGLYYQLKSGENTRYLILETTPTNAKNKDMYWVVAGEDGTSDFVTFNDQIADHTLAVDLNAAINKGMTGYIYILPADAVKSNSIKYYYKEANGQKLAITDGKIPAEGEEKVDYIDNAKDLAAENTYNTIMSYGYFKSNAREDTRNVAFANVIIKIKVEIADGSKAHPIRVFTAQDLAKMKENPSDHYLIMQDIVVENWSSFDVSGGIRGINEDVTITLNGTSGAFVNTVASGAYIEDLTLRGTVTGGGFVANENNGTISNVSVDANGMMASVLYGNADYVGGIAGKNNGIIDGCGVFGLSINAGGKTVGGIAGLHTGSILNSRVEFYNLLVKEGATKAENEYAHNTFTGAIVGGLVGQMQKAKEAPQDPAIERSYVYDYTLSKDTTEYVLLGTTVDPIVGNYSVGTANNVFAVVGLASTNIPNVNTADIEEENIKLTNFYLGYYDGGTYSIKSDYQVWNTAFVVPSTDAEKAINGGNPYLEAVQQPTKVSATEIDALKIATYEDINNYYKSVAVEEDRGILFFYDLRFGTDDLSVAEENDLNKLNTISLKDLLKVDNVNDSFIVSSSNVNIVRVLGSQLRVINTGDVTLTIASRQDASANKEIAIKVISSLSELKIYDEDGQEINGGNTLNIQRTKTKDLIVTQDKTTVRLGNLATKYDLIVTDIVVEALNVAIDGDGEALGDQSNVAEVDYSANQVSISTDKDTERTRVSISPVVFSEEESEGKYQTAIEAAFKKAFVVDATDGVISFKLSGDQITLSPSITTSIVANIQTTAADDTIVPVVSLKDSDKAMEREVVEGKHVYLDAAGNPVIVATIKPILPLKTAENGVYDYSFDITFAVADSYKSQVAEDMEFEVYFKAKSESQSNTFKMLLTKQDFTNIDTSSVKITNTSVQGSAVDGYYDEYKTGIQTSTLAPGNSSILKVFVNPEYAYYDYAEISYSGATIANAVNIEVVQPVAGRDGKIDHTTSTFRTLTDDMGTSQTVGTNLRYTPKTDKGYLYFKLWINTTVERDTTLMFTISFYNKNSDVPLDYVNHYIAVSYLTEPRVLINGQDTAFIAKGTKNEVKVEVLASQRLDSIAIDGTGYEGISLTNLTELPVDYARGIRTYTATLSCQLNAFSRDHGMLEIQATVSRELNGVKEIKTAIATAIIVDFKIDDILVDKAENNELTIWQNVSSPFDVKYKFDPDTSVLESDNDSLYQDEKEEILNKRAFFEKNHYYPQEVNSGDSSQSEYYINYIKGENGAFTKTTLLDRIFVEVDGQDVNWKDANLPFTFITNEHTDSSETYQIKGTRAASAPVEIIIKTYLYAGGVESTIETRVKIKVETFSDPDLPLPIRSEADFLALGEGSTGPNDYILETDLVLEDYTPFDTSNIRSLDGNGYTIYIKSFKIEESGPLNLALFKTVTKLTVTNTNPAEQTTLKNLRVNYYNGGQVIVDISNHKEIYMAGIAIENSGVITNCEVVSYYTDGLLEEPGNNTLGVTRKGLKLNSLPKGTKEGFNLSYRNGANVSEESFIADNSGITSQIAGFVLRNNGSITNSRVGGDSVMLFKDNTELASGQAREFITKDLGVFNIVGQGDISGFVLSNNGHIASSFVKNIDIQNNSAATKFYTAGFVGQNSSSSSIITSYIEGVRSTISSEDANNATERNRKKYANLGSSLKSEMGYLAGFAYINEGNIKDSYSNILIANSTDLQKVYLASGFVYQNDGTLENCYSASQVANANYAQMNFSGVDATGQLLKQGKYINCYFFNADDYSSEGQEDTDSSTESQFNTGALSIKDPSLKTSFYGFAVADAGEDVLHKDGIWEIDAEYGLKLIEPDYITYSHRKKIFVEGDVGTITATYDGKKYHLGYVELFSSTDSNNRISTILGTYHNPILVYDASDWQEIANINAASSYIKAQVDEISVKGVYRLVNNINLSSIHQELYSSTKNFSGALYGNGFVISGISLAQNSEVTVDKYGMFASVVAEQGKPALISNVDLQITKVTAGNAVAVGGLAGIVKNANIINIDVSFEDNAGAANVAGKNFVGGLIGLAYGDNKIKNITATNPNVVAASLFEYNTESFLTAAKESISSFRNSIESELQISAAKFSYAGSIVGFLDNYTQEGVTNFTGDDAETETYSINNIKVYGNVIIQGQVVGGVFGLTGYNTNIRDVGLVLNATDENASHIISTGFFAGGVVGQSFGKLSRVFAEHESSVQQQIEDGMGDFYGGNYTGAERGILTLFDTSKMEKQHKQKAVGGLVGYIGSGMMEVSYSKLNATSMSAQYAGGIVGMMDVQKAPQGYDVDLDRLAEKENGINYFFNEVFATGDVRANTMAGGLVGAIKGQESKIVMLSVNAFNYLTTYNYQTEKYEDLNLGQYEISSNFHINSFVGQFIYFDGTGKEHIEELKTDINKNDVNNQFYEIKCGSRALSDYIKFAEGLDSLGDSSTNKEQTSQGEKLPSVARYVNYSFKGQEVRLSRFGENILDKDGSYDKTNEESLDDLYKIYGIESASKYANSTAGRTYTQVGFIGSGVWSFTNWIHPMDDLFPSFRLKETYSVMYLDVYNAAYVFTEMEKDPSLVVIVRGLKTKGGDPELPG